MSDVGFYKRMYFVRDWCRQGPMNVTHLVSKWVFQVRQEALLALNKINLVLLPPLRGGTRFHFTKLRAKSIALTWQFSPLTFKEESIPGRLKDRERILCYQFLLSFTSVIALKLQHFLEILPRHF